MNTQKILLKVFTIALLFIICSTTNMPISYANSDDLAIEQLKSENEFVEGERKFFIENYVNADELQFVLVSVGEHCYIWIQYDIWVDDVEEDEYITIRQNVDRIYARMTSAIFDHANSWGDVDNDGHINVLFCNLYEGGIKGYYEPKNLRDTEISNKLDIIYIDLSNEAGLKDLRENNGIELWATIAHEFQHMLSDIALRDQDNELWLEESLSALSSYLYSSDTYYVDTYYFEYFLSDYGTRDGFLFHRLGVSSGKEYLMTTLFGIYLKSRFGENVIKEIYAEYEKCLTGKQAVESLIRTKNTTFNELFVAFIKATVCDLDENDRPCFIYDVPIRYNGKSYDSLYSLRLENELLYIAQNIEFKNYENTQWSEKTVYYDKEFFQGIGSVKIETNADNIFSFVKGEKPELNSGSEFNTHFNPEVIVLLVNCENDECNYKLVLMHDTFALRTLTISISFVLIAVSVALMIYFIVVYRSRKKRK